MLPDVDSVDRATVSTSTPPTMEISVCNYSSMEQANLYAPTQSITRDKIVPGRLTRKAHLKTS